MLPFLLLACNPPTEVVVDLPARAEALSWSPSGRYILASNRTDRWVVDATRTPLLVLAVPAVDPVWTPADQLIDLSEKRSWNPGTNAWQDYDVPAQLHLPLSSGAILVHDQGYRLDNPPRPPVDLGRARGYIRFADHQTALLDDPHRRSVDTIDLASGEHRRWSLGWRTLAEGFTTNGRPVLRARDLQGWDRIVVLEHPPRVARTIPRHAGTVSDGHLAVADGTVFVQDLDGAHGRHVPVSEDVHRCAVNEDIVACLTETGLLMTGG